ncbi:E3 ubiquitin-protein ligase RHA1B [Ananas comosus]|uniref:E3 ubiquitin-protein ligase RHA1B n=1 Tax=Ananas comosus TaxID=4615 RepID=A0A199VRV3_ANACO|nr:E3 ubiquitin-protein ligase RHA1B [Ananas comosus]
MGFPVGYSEVLLPKLFLHLVLLLGFVRRALSWALGALGLGDLLDPDSPWPDPAAAVAPALQLRRAEFRAVPALLIEELLPVVLYEEVGGESCAVCLSEMGRGEEVRRLSNCRHVFHRGCLDRWMVGHEQGTCPLCRAPLLPADAAEALGHGAASRVWAAAGIPDSSDFDLFDFSLPSPATPLPSPTLFLPHQLLPSSSS